MYWFDMFLYIIYLFRDVSFSFVRWTICEMPIFELTFVYDLILIC